MLGAAATWRWVEALELLVWSSDPWAKLGGCLLRSCWARPQLAPHSVQYRAARTKFSVAGVAEFIKLFTSLTSALGDVPVLPAIVSHVPENPSRNYFRPIHLPAFPLHLKRRPFFYSSWSPSFLHTSSASRPWQNTIKSWSLSNRFSHGNRHAEVWLFVLGSSRSVDHTCAARTSLSVLLS